MRRCASERGCPRVSRLAVGAGMTGMAGSARQRDIRAMARRAQLASLAILRSDPRRSLHSTIARNDDMEPQGSGGQGGCVGDEVSQEDEA